ncbi:Hypothetical protein UVM_LOCUS240 [uncultured virus]|nr:Hypothetical protein UVM_LOCUS240 [uncultured virus]
MSQSRSKSQLRQRLLAARQLARQALYAVDSALLMCVCDAVGVCCTIGARDERDTESTTSTSSNEVDDENQSDNNDDDAQSSSGGTKRVRACDDATVPPLRRSQRLAGRPVVTFESPKRERPFKRLRRVDEYDGSVRLSSSQRNQQQASENENTDEKEKPRDLPPLDLPQADDDRCLRSKPTFAALAIGLPLDMQPFVGPADLLPCEVTTEPACDSDGDTSVPSPPQAASEENDPSYTDDENDESEEDGDVEDEDADEEDEDSEDDEEETSKEEEEEDSSDEGIACDDDDPWLFREFVEFARTPRERWPQNAFYTRLFQSAIRSVAMLGGQARLPLSRHFVAMASCNRLRVYGKCKRQQKPLVEGGDGDDGATRCDGCGLKERCLTYRASTLAFDRYDTPWKLRLGSYCGIRLLALEQLFRMLNRARAVSNSRKSLRELFLQVCTAERNCLEAVAEGRKWPRAQRLTATTITQQ